MHDAKIKTSQIVGKVRIAPRGYRDKSWTASWYSTSPKATAVCVRVAELLGLRLRLESWAESVSDAFFSGEKLRDDEDIYIKVDQMLEDQVSEEFLERSCRVPGGGGGMAKIA